MQIGILFPTVDHSQRVYEATIAAHKMLQSTKNDIVFFYESLSNPFLPQRFATVHVSHMMSFPGVLISTDAHSARRISEVITSPHKIYYPYDLEWRKQQPVAYEYLVDVFRNRNLEIIARSSSHQGAISNGFNVECRVVEHFELDQLCQKYQENISMSTT